MQSHMDHTGLGAFLAPAGPVTHTSQYLLIHLAGRPVTLSKWLKLTVTQIHPRRGRMETTPNK